MSAFQKEPIKRTIANSVRNSYSLHNKINRYNDSGLFSPKGSTAGTVENKMYTPMREQHQPMVGHGKQVRNIRAS
jgi:hypothetical protein